MEILEIQNPKEVRHLFEEIPFEQRVMPSVIMILASSKGIILLILNVVLMSIVISTTWIDQREKSAMHNFEKQRKPVVEHNSAYTPD